MYKTFIWCVIVHSSYHLTVQVLFIDVEERSSFAQALVWWILQVTCWLGWWVCQKQSLKRVLQQKHPREVFYKKIVHESFAELTGKHLLQSLSFRLRPACNFIKKETLEHVLFCECYEIFKNTFCAGETFSFSRRLLLLQVNCFEVFEDL